MIPLRSLLLAEAITKRDFSNNYLMTKELTEVARNLRDKNVVIIRRADKTAPFVLIRADEYLGKRVKHSLTG